MNNTSSLWSGSKAVAICSLRMSPGMNPDRLASSAGWSLPPLSRLASGTITPIRFVCGRLINFGVTLGISSEVGSTGSPIG